MTTPLLSLYNTLENNSVFKQRVNIRKHAVCMLFTIIKLHGETLPVQMPRCRYSCTAAADKLYTHGSAARPDRESVSSARLSAFLTIKTEQPPLLYGGRSPKDVTGRPGRQGLRMNPSQETCCHVGNNAFGGKAAWSKRCIQAVFFWRTRTDRKICLFLLSAATKQSKEDNT